VSADLSPEQERALDALARVVDPAEYYLPLASLDDLSCMKLSAVAGRGARRDFWDLHALLQARGKSLGEVLDAHRRKYVQEDVGHLVRSLVYFVDAEAEPMPTGLTEEHWARIRSDLTTWVRAL
jgi:hypothetical protein